MQKVSLEPLMVNLMVSSLERTTVVKYYILPVSHTNLSHDIHMCIGFRT